MWTLFDIHNLEVLEIERIKVITVCLGFKWAISYFSSCDKKETKVVLTLFSEFKVRILRIHLFIYFFCGPNTLPFFMYFNPCCVVLFSRGAVTEQSIAVHRCIGGFHGLRHPGYSDWRPAEGLWIFTCLEISLALSLSLSRSLSLPLALSLSLCLFCGFRGWSAILRSPFLWENQRSPMAPRAGETALTRRSSAHPRSSLPGAERP